MFYPLKFIPIYKKKIWGGQKLKSVLKRPDALGNDTGESWEISAVQDNISIIEKGEFKNLKINELISEYKEKIVGKKVYEQFGSEFPLLIKFIDANQDLSVQVHPRFHEPPNPVPPG